MSDRITVKDLRNLAARLDRMAGFDPETPVWTRECKCDPDTGIFNHTAKGCEGGTRNVAQVGRYVIDGAYGGWELHQIMTEGGGIRVIAGQGHRPARDLYDRMQAYIAGLEDAKR